MNVVTQHIYMYVCVYIYIYIYIYICIYIILQFCISEEQHSSHWAKIKVSPSLHSFQRTLLTCLFQHLGATHIPWLLVTLLHPLKSCWVFLKLLSMVFYSWEIFLTFEDPYDQIWPIWVIQDKLPSEVLNFNDLFKVAYAKQAMIFTGFKN